MNAFFEPQIYIFNNFFTFLNIQIIIRNEIIHQILRILMFLSVSSKTKS